MQTLHLPGATAAGIPCMRQLDKLQMSNVKGRQAAKRPGVPQLGSKFENC